MPVIFLSAYGRDQLIASAFDMGVVDYAVKPFSPTELAARIRAALPKRAASEPTEPYVLSDLTIDYAERRVTVAGRPVQLTAVEFRMLGELSANAGRVLTYEHLLQRVWGVKSNGDVRPMYTVTSSLLRKLGDDSGQPHLHLHRASRRLPDAEGRGAGAGDAMTVTDWNVTPVSVRLAVLEEAPVKPLRFGLVFTETQRR